MLLTRWYGLADLGAVVVGDGSATEILQRLQRLRFVVGGFEPPLVVEVEVEVDAR